MIKKLFICASAAAILSLAGCGNKQDANAKNFLPALVESRNAKIDVCLDQPYHGIGLWLGYWPGLSIEKGQKVLEPLHEKELDALVNLGLLTAVYDALPETEKVGDQYRKTGAIIKVKRYEISELGEKFHKKFEDGEDICYAEAVPDKIVKWEGPMQRGAHQVVDVTFTRKVVNISEWANNEAFKVAFNLQSHIDDAQKAEAVKTLKLTSQGWEPM